MTTLLKKCLSLLGEILPPFGETHDLVAEKRALRDSLRGAAKYSGYLALVGLGATLLKLIVFFHGDTNYILAILERKSLSDLATMTVASMVVAFIPAVCMFLAASVAGTGMRNSVRSAIVISLPFIMIVLSGILTWWVLIATVLTYLAGRLAAVVQRRRTPKTISVEEWGKCNLKNEDTELRRLATEISQKDSIDDEERSAYAQAIQDRNNAITAPIAPRWASTMWPSFSGMIVGILLSAPALSPLYSFDLPTGRTTGYVVEGPRDTAIIKYDDWQVETFQKADVKNFQLCSASRADQSWWLLRPVINPRGTRGHQCP